MICFRRSPVSESNHYGDRHHLAPEKKTHPELVMTEVGWDDLLHKASENLMDLRKDQEKNMEGSGYGCCSGKGSNKELKLVDLRGFTHAYTSG